MQTALKLLPFITLLQGGAALSAQTPCDPRVDQTKPCFTPYDQKPTLRNRAEVVRSLARNYPLNLKQDSIGGSTLVWLLIDDTGGVRSRSVHQTSSIPELDSAALRVANELLFTPARLQGEAKWVWIQLPIVFCVKCPYVPPAR